MFATWKDQLEKCEKNAGPIAVTNLVALHKERWKMWEMYIATLDYEEVYRSERDWGGMSPDMKYTTFVELLGKETSMVHGREEKTAWSKRLFTKGTDYILLDASFGSLNYTSDLDINVVSTTPYAMERWMEFTKQWVKKSHAQSFCEYWDSNFYYEPGVVDGKVGVTGNLRANIVSIPQLLLGKGFEWTSDSTAMYELQCVDAYTNAYELSKDLVQDGFRSSPNPVQFTSAKEQKSYKTSLHFAEAFRRAYESYLEDTSLGDTVRFAYLKYAVTKIEGLVSVTSLAVCDVFGKAVFFDYVRKKGKGKYLKPYMAGIAAYEMLRNLRMHSHTGRYKSKYANRLMYVLSNVEGLCVTHRRDVRHLDKLDKTNEASVKMIANAIAFLLDFMDGVVDYGEKSCEFSDLKRKDVWVANLGTTLDTLCEKTRQYVEGYIKESTGVRNGKDQEKEGIDFVKGLIK